MGKRVYKKDYITNEEIFYVDENFIQTKNSSGTYNETYYYHDNVLVGKEDNNGKWNFLYSIEESDYSGNKERDKQNQNSANGGNG